MWKFETVQTIQPPGARSGDSIEAIALSPSGGLLANSRNNVYNQALAHRGMSFLLPEDEGTAAAESQSALQIDLWNLQNREFQQTLGLRSDQHSPSAPAFQPIWIKKLTFSPDDQFLAVQTCRGARSDCNLAGAAASCTQVLRLSTGELQMWDTHAFHAFSPDGHLVTSTENGQIQFWNLSTGELQRTLEGLDPEIWAIAFTPDSQRLAIVAGSFQDFRQQVQVWNGSADQRLYSWQAGRRGETLPSLAISPDGQLLACNSHTEIHRWHLSTGETLPSLAAFEARMTFLQTGKLFSVTYCEDLQAIAIWDMPTGVAERFNEGESAVTLHASAVATDGSVVYGTLGNELITVSKLRNTVGDVLLRVR